MNIKIYMLIQTLSTMWKNKNSHNYSTEFGKLQCHDYEDKQLQCNLYQMTQGKSVSTSLILAIE